MKFSAIITLSIILGITGCKKNYGCECTDKSSTIRFAIRDTKKEAKKKCEETEYHETGSCEFME